MRFAPTSALLILTFCFAQTAITAEPIKVAPEVSYVIHAKGLKGPRGLLIDHKGDLYALEQNAGTLVRIDQNGRITQLAKGFSEPHDLEINSEGNFFVADTGNARVARVTPGGEVETFIDALSTPVDLAFNAAGELLVCEYGAQRITAYISSEKRRVFISGFIPHGIAFTRDGLTLVNDLSNKRIVVVNADGASTPLALNIDTPVGLAVGPSGDVYVPESIAGKLHRIKRDGSRVVLLEGLARPRDPTFDRDGHLYVAESDAGRILKLTGSF